MCLADFGHPNNTQTCNTKMILFGRTGALSFYNQKEIVLSVFRYCFIATTLVKAPLFYKLIFYQHFWQQRHHFSQISWRTLAVDALKLERAFLQHSILLTLCSCQLLSSQYRHCPILSPGFTLSSCPFLIFICYRFNWWPLQSVIFRLFLFRCNLLLYFFLPLTLILL